MIKFIVDAQLPYRLAILLREKGFGVKHTDDLPNKEVTIDSEILTLAKIENRSVITKDNDFLNHISLTNPHRAFYLFLLVIL